MQRSLWELPLGGAHTAPTRKRRAEVPVAIDSVYQAGLPAVP
jgi:hypothetical protein